MGENKVAYTEYICDGCGAVEVGALHNVLFKYKWEIRICHTSPGFGMIYLCSTCKMAPTSVESDGDKIRVEDVPKILNNFRHLDLGKETDPTPDEQPPVIFNDRWGSRGPDCPIMPFEAV